MSNNFEELSALHHAVLRSFVDRGFAPTREELAEQLSMSAPEVKRQLRSLADEHGIVLHPHNDEVWVAHPFSAVPTNFILRRGAREWWGNCAWCALGAAALIGGDLTISTVLGANGRWQEIRIREGRVVPDDLVVHFPVPMTQAWDNVHFTCSVMLAFASEADVDAWCRAHRIAKGDVRPIDQIWRLARDWYGRHLDRDWRKWTVDEAAEIFARHGLDGPIWELPRDHARF